MKKFSVIFAFLMFYFSGYYAEKGWNYHNFFFRDAGDITSGIFNNSRIDSSSVTKQGNFSNGILFPDMSVQTTAAGSSQWVTSGSDIKNVNTGNVGVGSPTPTSKLHIFGSLTSSAATTLATTEGNVGIGTTGQSSKLDVFGGSITVRGGGAGLMVGGGSLTVQTGGNVGIGTVSPSSLLDVLNGSVTIRGTNAGLVVPTITNVSQFSFVDASSLTRVGTADDVRLATNVAVALTPVNVASSPYVTSAQSLYVSTSAQTMYQIGISSVNRQSTGLVRVTFAPVWRDASSYQCQATGRMKNTVYFVAANEDDAFIRTASQIQFRTARIDTSAEVDVERLNIACSGYH